MRSTSVSASPNKITVNLKELQSLLSVGRYSAEKIGSDAGAVVRIGKRKVYRVQKVLDYLDAQNAHEEW